MSADGAERIHGEKRRLELLHGLHDAVEDRVEILADGFLAEVEEADRRRNPRDVEERELLLVPHQFHARLAKHGEVECGALR